MELNPLESKTYSNRGKTYIQKGKYDEAISDYTRALELNPRQAEAYSDRGAVYITLHKKEKACADWKKACEFGNCYNYNLAKRRGDCESEEGYKKDVKTAKGERMEAKIVDRPLVERLIVSLGDTDPTVRWESARRLGEIKEKSAVDSLITALKDNHPFVRRRASVALGEIRDPKAIEPLISVLKRMFPLGFE